jgi:hypothetical protein
MATPPPSPEQEAELARFDDEVKGMDAVLLVRQMRATAAERGESVRAFLMRAIRAELERLKHEAAAERNTTTEPGTT